MDLELVKFLNSDLTWNAVKKGHRSKTRRPRRPGASSSKFGIGSSNKKQDLVVFDYEKSGVAILGQHFAEEVLDVPLKKRILMLQSPCLSSEGARSPHPQLPSLHHEESELLVGSKHVSGEQCHSNSQSNMKLKNGSSNTEKLKLMEKNVPDLNDFSGIELLAAAACHSSVYDSSDHVDSSAVEEHTTPKVDSYTDGVKDDIVPMDSDDSSVQDSTFPATHDNGNLEGDKKSVPSKDVRLHWDLNTVMDDWEEPCCDILVDPHSEKGYSKDALQNAKTNPEGDDGVCANQSGKLDAAISVMPLSTPETFGIQENTDADSFEKTYDVVEDIASSKEALSDGRPAVSEVVQDDKLTSEDRLSDCCGSNERNTVNKANTGYDSPVEDGELREASKYTWQKNEVEELECVDYESDNIYEDNFDTIEFSLDHPQTNPASGTEVTESINDIEQDDKTDVPSRPDHLEHPQRAISQEKSDDNNSRKFVPERKNMNDDRLTSFGVRKNESCIRRSRSDNFGDSYSRTERDFGQKFMGYQGRPRNDWDSRNSHRYPRPKHVIDNNHQPMTYNPRGTYKTFNTRPSPSDRNESYGIRRGTPPAREIFKGGSGLSRRARAPQDEYNNHDHPCLSERKVTSFSSSFNRGGHSRSRRRSRSRSRSESPIAWHFQKKRNLDTKTETPDYRSSDTRLQQERFSFRKPGSEIESRRFEPHGYLGRLTRFPQATRPNNKDTTIIHDDRYGGGRFRYSMNTRNKDDGFRYTRNENRCFKDPVGRDETTFNKMFTTTPFRDGDFHKD